MRKTDIITNKIIANWTLTLKWNWANKIVCNAPFLYLCFWRFCWQNARKFGWPCASFATYGNAYRIFWFFFVNLLYYEYVVVDWVFADVLLVLLWSRCEETFAIMRISYILRYYRIWQMNKVHEERAKAREREKKDAEAESARHNWFQMRILDIVMVYLMFLCKRI